MIPIFIILQLDQGAHSTLYPQVSVINQVQTSFLLVIHLAISKVSLVSELGHCKKNQPSVDTTPPSALNNRSIADRVDGRGDIFFNLCLLCKSMHAFA